MDIFRRPFPPMPGRRARTGILSRRRDPTGTGEKTDAQAIRGACGRMTVPGIGGMIR